MSKSKKSSDKPNTNNELKNEKRRQIVRGTAGGAALFAGAKWSTPVVQNVILPAHANTSIIDPCNIKVTIPSQGSPYATTVSGNLIGAADKIGGVDGSITLQYLNCFGLPIFDQTMPVTTANDGYYDVDFVQQLGQSGSCPNGYITEIVAQVNFPGIDQVVCPADVKNCPCV